MFKVVSAIPRPNHVVFPTGNVSQSPQETGVTFWQEGSKT